MNTDRRFTTASDSFDIEALMAEIDDGVRRRGDRLGLLAGASDVLRVRGGRVMPLRMAA